jgi:ATP-dependent Clp endopeptidase proteolytic subunit ClpP
MSKAWGFKVHNADPETIEIDVYDVIGESFWNEGVTAKQVRSLLKQSPNAKTIKMRVNSAGGDVIDGFAIYNLLAEHPARVEADVDSLAASMASVIIMAADEIRMSASAMVMIHNPWGATWGESDDLRSYADLLDKMRDQIADAYVARTGQTRDEIIKMMDSETWLTATEAKAKGFADKVKKSKAKMAAAASFTGLDLSSFGNVPPEFLAALKRPAEEPKTKNELPPPQDRVEETSQNPIRKDKENIMTNPEILKALGLPEDADDATALDAVKKLQTSARTGVDIEKILGSSGDKAVGAVRALKASETAQTELAEEVAKVKVQLAKRDFDGEVKNGFDKKKLTPALAKMYSDRFDAAVAKGLDGSEVVADLQGYIAHAPSIGALSMRRPAPTGPGESEGPLAFNGKTFAQMKPMDRHNLKGSDPELYALMRADWEEAGKPAA